MVASLYEGMWSHDGATAAVSAATFEPRLEQIGQDEAQIRIGLRAYAGRESRIRTSSCA